MMYTKVRVRDQGNPVTYVLPEGVVPQSGDTVLFEGDKGTTYGVVFAPPFTPPPALACCQRPRGEVRRIATNTDQDQIRQLHEREAEMLEFCRDRAAALRLDMKVLEMEGVLSGKNMTCYFSAEQRVDFRQLVRDLGGRFRCHVLMRQISSREEARRMCGIGPCGRTLCCASFLDKPHGVSSREARRIAPGVSHSKLTGVCGKLMCCLAYEAPSAEEENLVSIA